jgi:hypothetical protein
VLFIFKFFQVCIKKDLHDFLAGLTQFKMTEFPKYSQSAAEERLLLVFQLAEELLSDVMSYLFLMFFPDISDDALLLLLEALHLIL